MAEKFQRVYIKKIVILFYFSNDLFKDIKVETENVAGKFWHFIELSQNSSSNYTRESVKRTLFGFIYFTQCIRQICISFYIVRRITIWSQIWSNKSNANLEAFLELVSKELNHFRLIAGLFRQIGGHSM